LPAHVTERARPAFGVGLQGASQIRKALALSGSAEQPKSPTRPFKDYTAFSLLLEKLNVFL
jgi:hypothetical protein